MPPESDADGLARLHLARQDGGQRGCPGSLDHQLRSFEQDDDGAADLVLADLDDLVDEALDERERQVPGTLHGDAVGDGRDTLDVDRPAGRERRRPRCTAFGLHADHAHLGPQRLDGDGNAGEQTAAAQRHDDRVGVRGLLEHLQPDRALARDDRLVVERRHEDPALRIGARGGVALLERLAREHDLRAVVGRRDLLRERGVDRHVDARRDAERGRSERDALGVVAGAGGDDAACTLVVAQRGHAIDRAAQLEGARALQVLGLEQHARARPARDRARRQHGRGRHDALDHAARALDVLEADHGGHRSP